MRRLAIAFGLILFACQASGLTLLVPTEYPNIQNAINSTAPGDSVLVLPGIYSGPGFTHLNYLGKDIVVRSRDGSAATTLELFDYEPGVTLGSAETLAAVFEGFTILASEGRAVDVNNASLTIRDLVIRLPDDGFAMDLSNGDFIVEDVEVDGQGAWSSRGITLRDANATLSDIFVHDCYDQGLYAYASLVNIYRLVVENVWVGDQAPVTILYGSINIYDSVFVDCTGDIGGALKSSHGSIVVENALFLNNEADRFGGAVALQYDGTLGVFRNCSFIRNSAEHAAAGLICYEFAHGSVEDCVFYDNYGDALEVSWAQSFLNVDNTIVAFNEGYGILTGDPVTIEIDCCDVFGNGQGNYQGIEDQTGINGNISEDPLFCNEGGVDEPLSISENSPCLPANNDCAQLIGPCATGCELQMYAITGHIESDEGVPLAGAQISGHFQNYYTDANGDYLVPSIEGWSGTLSPYIGNYHFTPASRSYEHLSGDVPDQDYLGFFSTMHLVPSEYPSIGEALAIALEGDTILVAPGIYGGENNRNLEFRGENVVLISSAGAEQTIIDCEEQGRAFLLHFGESSQTVIDGFTITGGRATDELTGGSRGGGILIHAASPTLRNLVIRDCQVAEGYGGGMAIEECSSIMDGIHFINNEVPGFGGNGGGLHMNDATPLMAHLFFHNNYAYRYGGAICALGSHYNIIHATIVSNTAGWGGGGLAGTEVYNAIMTASIIAENRSTIGGAVFHGNYFYTCDFECSLFFDNDELPFGGNFESPIGSDGNLDSDPMFCDPGNGNFELRSDSPCLPENNDCGVQIGAFGEGCP